MLLSVTARASAASYAKELGKRHAAATNGGAREGVLAKGEITGLFSQGAARGLARLRHPNFFRRAVASGNGFFFEEESPPSFCEKRDSCPVNDCFRTRLSDGSSQGSGNHESVMYR